MSGYSGSERSIGEIRHEYRQTRIFGQVCDVTMSYTKTITHFRVSFSGRLLISLIYL
jgi:hypothetical protein